MTWIESHQELGAHPKTRKLARILGLSRPAVVGHLQFLWWWAVDYAEDGDITRFDPLDIALGAEWEGEAQTFLDALVSAGFVDSDAQGVRIHDWHDYAGKLIERRRANAQRMRESRAAHVQPERPHVQAPAKERATHVQRTQRARAERPYRTVPNPTEPNQETTAAAVASKSLPFDVLAAVCEELGQDVSALGERERSKQCGFAKQLVEADVGPDDARRMVRWLAPQSWVIKGGGVDLKLMAGQVGKWVMQGRPDRPPAPPELSTVGPRRINESAESMAERAAKLEADIAHMQKTNAPDWKIANVRRELDKARAVEVSA